MVEPSSSSYVFVWWRNPDGFNVKRALSRLQALSCRCTPIAPNLSSALRKFWKSNVFSNIQVFTLRFFLNRVQTKDELAERGIIYGPHNMVCPLGFGEIESHLHLFLLCPKTVLVWCKILDWIGLGYFPSRGSILIHVKQYDRKMKDNIKKEFRLFI